MYNIINNISNLNIFELKMYLKIRFLMLYLITKYFSKTSR
jgi:hypothetical protein